jgi:hypothetical protein
MAQLDRKRSYGTVNGDGALHAFEQDGKLFDANGEEISRKAATQKPAPAPTEPTKDVGKEPDGNAKQADQQLRGE